MAAVVLVHGALSDGLDVAHAARCEQMAMQAGSVVRRDGAHCPGSRDDGARRRPRARG